MTSSFITLDASKLDPSQIGDISTDLGIENVHAPETLEVVRIVFLAGEVAADGTLTKMIRSKKDKGTGLYNPGSGKWLEAKANDPNVKHYVPSKLKIFNYRMDENGTIYYKESKESDDWLMVPIYTDVPALVEEDPDLVELLQKHKTCKEIVTLLRKNGYYVPSVSAFNLMRSDYELDENEDIVWVGRATAESTTETLAGEMGNLKVDDDDDDEYPYLEEDHAQANEPFLGNLHRSHGNLLVEDIQEEASLLNTEVGGSGFLQDAPSVAPTVQSIHNPDDTSIPLGLGDGASYGHTPTDGDHDVLALDEDGFSVVDGLAQYRMAQQEARERDERAHANLARLQVMRQEEKKAIRADLNAGLDKWMNTYASLGQGDYEAEIQAVLEMRHAPTPGPRRVVTFAPTPAHHQRSLTTIQGTPGPTPGPSPRSTQHRRALTEATGATGRRALTEATGNHLTEVAGHPTPIRRLVGQAGTATPVRQGYPHSNFRTPVQPIVQRNNRAATTGGAGRRQNSYPIQGSGMSNSTANTDLFPTQVEGHPSSLTFHPQGPPLSPIVNTTLASTVQVEDGLIPNTKAGVGENDIAIEDFIADCNANNNAETTWVNSFRIEQDSVVANEASLPTFQVEGLPSSPSRPFQVEGPPPSPIRTTFMLPTVQVEDRLQLPSPGSLMADTTLATATDGPPPSPIRTTGLLTTVQGQVEDRLQLPSPVSLMADTTLATATEGPPPSPIRTTGLLTTVQGQVEDRLQLPSPVSLMADTTLATATVQVQDPPQYPDLLS